MPVFQPKTCERCFETFTPRSSQSKYCESCRCEHNAEYHHEWYINNAEHVREQERARHIKNAEHDREYWREYRIKNAGKIRERSREWRNKNAEHKREDGREYYIKNVEHVRRRTREWGKSNPDKRKVYDHNRRARINGNGGSFTADELNALFDEQAGFCAYCGHLLFESFETPFHIEHKVPISRGGSNYIENISLSCSKCNLSKHTKTDEEFLASLARR